MTQDMQHAHTRKGRVIGSVIAASGVLSILAPWLVQVLGLPGRYEILIYLFSLAGFIWAFVNIYQLWRARRNMQG